MRSFSEYGYGGDDAGVGGSMARWRATTVAARGGGYASCRRWGWAGGCGCRLGVASALGTRCGRGVGATVTVEFCGAAT